MSNETSTVPTPSSSTTGSEPVPPPLPPPPATCGLAIVDPPEASTDTTRNPTNLIVAAPPSPVQMDGALGTIELRTPAEDLEFQACEAMVSEGWRAFVKVGIALRTIRDKRLYKNEYSSFEEYCRDRWGFRATHVWALISAAEVVKRLETIPNMPLPQCEAHVRPLVGLPPDRAQEVWLEALAKAPKGQVTARLIQRLVKRMKQAEGIQAAESKQNPQQRFETRRSVRNGLQELLTLLMQRAEHDLLIGKVLSLQRLLEPLLNPRKTKK